MEDTLLAYSAGLVDGDGSIVIGCSKRKGQSDNHWLQVGIANTNKELIDWLQETFGGHVSLNTSDARIQSGRRPCYHWRLMGKEASDFLKLLRPYLRIKVDQATTAIEFQEYASSTHLSITKVGKSEVVARREQYRVALRKLTMSRQKL